VESILSELMEPPTLAIDPYATDVVADPYPFHKALRDAGPIVRIEKYGVYAVGGHEEVRQILLDHQRFSSAGGVGIQDIRKPGRFRIPSRLVDADPPDHTVVRTAMSKILTPILIRSWREMFEQEAAKRVEKILDMREIDGIEDLAEAFVLTVFPKAVGVVLPRKEVLAIGEMRFNQSGPENELYHRAMAKAEPYLEWFDASCERSGVLPGSIGDLIYQAEDRGEIEVGTANSLLRTFVGGGTDSTISGIGSALNQLSSHQDQWVILQAEPARARTALDEAIRFESPFQVIYRTTNRETDFNGYRIADHAKVGLWLGASNRDPRKWPNADRFDLTRQTAGIHVAFGSGEHICIGQMLARLESECLLVALTKRVKSITRTGEPVYRLMNQMRAIDRLPLRVTPL